MRLFAQVGRNLQELDAPPPGKGYMIVPIPNELIEKTGKLDAEGHFQRELSELLERTIVEFFRTRPISISTPAAAAPRGMFLYDSRDPLKDPL